jgi:hypothetical protein
MTYRETSNSGIYFTGDYIMLGAHCKSHYGGNSVPNWDSMKPKHNSLGPVVGLELWYNRPRGDIIAAITVEVGRYDFG